jgi:hypothetical protein
LYVFLHSPFLGLLFPYVSLSSSLSSLFLCSMW